MPLGSSPSSNDQDLFIGTTFAIGQDQPHLQALFEAKAPGYREEPQSLVLSEDDVRGWLQSGAKIGEIEALLTEGFLLDASYNVDKTRARLAQIALGLNGDAQMGGIALTIDEESLGGYVPVHESDIGEATLTG